MIELALATFEEPVKTQDISISYVYTQAALEENGLIGDYLTHILEDIWRFNELESTLQCFKNTQVCNETTNTFSVTGEYVMESEFPTDITLSWTIPVFIANNGSKWAREANGYKRRADVLVFITAFSETLEDVGCGGLRCGGVARDDGYIWIVGSSAVGSTAFAHEMGHVLGAKHVEGDFLMHKVTSGYSTITEANRKKVLDNFKRVSSIGFETGGWKPPRQRVNK